MRCGPAIHQGGGGRGNACPPGIRPAKEVARPFARAAVNPQGVAEAEAALPIAVAAGRPIGGVKAGERLDHCGGTTVLYDQLLLLLDALAARHMAYAPLAVDTPVTMEAPLSIRLRKRVLKANAR